MNILFITANRVGDAVLSTGVLAWLAERYPDARFTIACGPYAADLFRATPRLDKIFILKKQPWNRHWLELWRATSGTRWDLIVDLRNSVISRLLPAKKRAIRTKNTGQHKVFDNSSVLDALGADEVPAPHIWLDIKAEAEAAQLLPKDRPILALGPAANWPCKQWPVERFAELAKKITGDLLPEASVMVIADTHEREQIAPVLQSLPANKRIEVIGRDLLTAAACLKYAKLFVGNDSGLMHIAAAMNVPTLGLFGPGYEDIYGPWGPHAAFVRTTESREELLARLPHPGAHEPNLMQGLSVDAVYEAAKNLLAR